MKEPTFFLRIALLSFLLTSSLRSMEKEQLKPNNLSKNVQQLFIEAFKAYNLPLNLIQLKGIKSLNLVEGTTYPLDNIIKFTDGSNIKSEEDLSLLEFGAYHEVGHMVDEELKQLAKKTPYIQAKYYGLTALPLCLLSTTLVLKGIPRAWADRNPGLCLTLLASSFIGPALLGLKAAQKARDRYHAPFEHRANELAIEKLLEKAKFDPIIGYMSILKAYEYRGIARVANDHPLASEEFRHMEQVLERKGYTVISEGNKQQKKCTVTLNKQNETLGHWTINWK